jgi:hypothetical protein
MDTLKLDQNVSQLTRAQKRPVPRDTGTTWTGVASLLDQLRDACRPGMEGGTGSGGTPAPVALNALDLLNRIAATTTSYWHLYTTVRVKGTLEDRLQAWAANTRSHAEDDVHTAEHITAGWITQITDLFDPPKRQVVDGNCPECGARYTYGIDDGDMVRKPALQVTVIEGGQSYAECGDCGTVWDRGQMHLLAAVLEAA